MSMTPKDSPHRLLAEIADAAATLAYELTNRHVVRELVIDAKAGPSFGMLLGQPAEVVTSVGPVRVVAGDDRGRRQGTHAIGIPSWKDVHDHAKEHPAGLWLVRPTGEMPVIVALEARVLSTIWGRCVASGTAWLPISAWADDGATWRRCDDDGVPVDVSADLRRQLAGMEADRDACMVGQDMLRDQLTAMRAERDDARINLARVEDALPALWSEGPEPVYARVAMMAENRACWESTGRRWLRRYQSERKRVAELQAERVPGSELEFQARLDEMKEAERDATPASPTGAHEFSDCAKVQRRMLYAAIHALSTEIELADRDGSECDRVVVEAAIDLARHRLREMKAAGR